MIPYILLIAVPALFTFAAIAQNDDGCYVLRVNRYTQKHSLALPCFFAILLLLLVLRHETLGRDLVNYKIYFEVYPQQDLRNFDLFRLESLFRIFNWFIGQFTDSYRIYLGIVAVITVLPMAYVYSKERRHSYMQIVLFVSMSTFVMLFSGLRQAITVSLGMVAYELVKKKKRIWFFLIVVLSLGFHHSAFMIAVMYPLYYTRIKKKHVWIVAPIVVVLFLFNRQVFELVVQILSNYIDKYELTLETTSGYAMLILFAAFVVFSFVVADEKKMDSETFGLRNFLLIALLLQCFAPVHPLAMRMNYYFLPFIPIAMAKIVSIPRKGMERVAKLASVLISLYFTFDFLYKTYQSCVTGISPLDTVPYIPFWG